MCLTRLFLRLALTKLVMPMERGEWVPVFPGGLVGFWEEVEDRAGLAADAEDPFVLLPKAEEADRDMGSAVPTAGIVLRPDLEPTPHPHLAAHCFLGFGSTSFSRFGTLSPHEGHRSPGKAVHPNASH